MGWNFRKKKDIPGGLWLKCPDCSAMLQRRVLAENLNFLMRNYTPSAMSGVQREFE